MELSTRVAEPQALKARLASSPTGTLLPNGSVTTEKLADGSVTTAKMSDGSVTAAKLGVQLVYSVTDGDMTISLA